MPKDSGIPLSGKATVDALADQWGTILALIMHKYNITDVMLTPSDMQALGTDGVMRYSLVPGPGKFPNEIRIRLMPIAEAIAEAKRHTGGFGRS